MTIDVPFLDLDAAYVELRPQIDAAVSGVLASGRYLLGAQTEAFEAEFAAACSAAHCVTVGPKVIATGVFAVPDPRSGDQVMAAIEVADLAAIRRVADRHGLALVEDAAQSTGARGRDGAVVGSGSTAAAFSFYPGKNLGALGDGGAVVTDDDDLARRVRLLRNYGSVAKYVHEVRGTNSRLDEIQAAVLRAKLPLLDAWNARRATIAALYLDRLEEASGVRLPPHDQGRSAWHLFVVRCHDRETLQRELTRHGVETLVHYPTPVHLSAAYADHGHRAGSLPHAERLAREVLSLPIGPHLALPAAERVADLVAVLAARP